MIHQNIDPKEPCRLTENDIAIVHNFLINTKFHALEMITCG
jgi:hypothetical protein